MKKVVITGATGFIGGALTRRLLADGVRVYGVGRDLEKLNEMKRYGDFIPVKADFEQYGKLHELIPERDFDFFWHFAWQGTSAREYNDYIVQTNNIKAACAAVNSAVTLNCQSVNFVSSYQQSNSCSENNGLNPVMYGVVKRCAMDLFKTIAYQNKLSCVNVVLPNVYGVSDKQNTAIVFFIKSLLTDKPLSLISGKHKDDWMPIEDIVEGFLYVMKSPRKYADYYVGHRNITTFEEKLVTMKTVLGSKSELNFGTYPEQYFVDYSAFDLEALYNDTDFEPKTDFRDSILKTAEWVKTILN